MKIQILFDSAVNTDADAIVNAANTHLLAGSGICGAIFDKAGRRELQAECDKIGYCEVGQAVITNGYNLKSKYIIHTVGPRYYQDPNPNEHLKSAYLSSLTLADNHGLKSVAFPCISTGIYGFPLEQATRIALNTIMNYQSKNIENVYLYCYKKEEYDMYLKIYTELTN